MPYLLLQLNHIDPHILIQLINTQSIERISILKSIKKQSKFIINTVHLK